MAIAASIWFLEGSNVYKEYSYFPICGMAYFITGIRLNNVIKRNEIINTASATTGVAEIMPP